MAAPSIHGSCVAYQGQAVLVQGPSGSGKSSLCLMLMSLGCRLVADDRVLLNVEDGTLIARCPPAIKGTIEARGAGLLRADVESHAKVVLVADLNQSEIERLPRRRQVTLLGCDIALINAIEGPHFAATILQILKAGWSDL